MNDLQNITFTEKEKDEVLKRFMLEFFDFYTLKKAGFWPKGVTKRDYKAQAERVCQFFGYKTVFEYGSKEARCHLTDGKTNRPFVTVVESIYK
jgi:hypothetical protein